MGMIVSMHGFSCPERLTKLHFAHRAVNFQGSVGMSGPRNVCLTL
jgi:hypothetical protein